MRRSERFQEQHRAAYPPDEEDMDRHEANSSRASYPFDVETPGAVQNRNENIPDSNRQAVLYQQTPSAYRPMNPPSPSCDAPYVMYADSAPYPDAAYQAAPMRGFSRPGSPAANASPPPVKDRRNRNGAPWGIIAFIAGALLCGLIALVFSAYTAYAPFRQKVERLSAPVFSKGIYIDNVDIGGLTMEAAKNALSASNAHSSQLLQLTVTVDQYTFQMTQNDVPFERNTQSVLDTAYAIGRSNSSQTLNTSSTPFDYRYNHLIFTEENQAYLTTSITYDKSDVRAFVNTVASYVVKEPVDAMVATFDFNTRTFTFTEEVAGASLDTEALYITIVEQLDQKNFNAVIQAFTTAVLPAQTRVELMNTFALVSTYTTTTTANYNRNVNINLAAQAINGTVMNAGDTFSFNSATGQRTTAKGYLEAAAIAGGTTTEEVGGGVCQVSSTLFNTAMLADLELVSRSPHTWPSTYVDPGRDATVNWPNLDFKFKNQRDTPVFIVCYFTQGKSMSSKGELTVELYGVTLEAGVTIDLQTKLISTEKPPSEPLYQRNASLDPGTERELKKARTGYVYETYRVYKRGGVEQSRSLLCKSTYKMIQQVIEYN